MVSKQNKKEKTPKSKYNMAQNSWFMIKLAWTTKEKKVIFLSLSIAFLAVAINLINLYVSPVILGLLEKQASLKELLSTIVLFVFALMITSAAYSYVNVNSLYGRVTVRTEIITACNKKAATTSYPNLFDEKFRKLTAKVQEATCSNRASAEGIWTTLTNLVQNLLGFFIYVLLLSKIQPFLILIILLTATMSYFAGNCANAWKYRHHEEEAEIEKQLLYLSTKSRNIAAAKDIRIFGLRLWIEELHDKAMQAYMAYQYKAQNVYFKAAVLDLLLSFLRNGIAYAYLIQQVFQSGLGVSEFLLYFSAVSGFASWITGILENFNTLHKQSLDISFVRQFLEFNEPFEFEGGEPIKKEADKNYELRLENVSFRYPNADKDTLKNINLVLHPEEKLAVVGLNGAGKTTLIKLICGFLDPTEGRILLDGKDIRKLNRRDYYALFSAVFQDFSLLPGTVATNVAQSVENIDMDKVKKCIDKADLTKKIESLKEGYQTNLNRDVFEDAILFSGGETQRLMLARALYKDAPFIILDEPTAALDPIAESQIYNKYNEMTKHKSSIYISHRLASTRFCDRIILIDDGKIAEEGTHEELLKLNGKYTDFFEVQSKYYKEEYDHEEN